MEYRIRTFKNEEGIFAEIINENGENICVGEGLTELKAVKDACLVFVDITDDLREANCKECFNYNIGDGIDDISKCEGCGYQLNS